MADWQRKLNLTDIWTKVDTGEMTIQQLSAEIAKRLRNLRPLAPQTADNSIDDERDDLVDEFEGLSEDPEATTGDFDSVMNRLYDWGDMPLDDKWPPKKVCWIATTF